MRFQLGPEVHQVECRLAAWQHQSHIHVVWYKSLLQQPVQVQPALKVKEAAVGDRLPLADETDIFLSIILSIFVHSPAFNQLSEIASIAEQHRQVGPVGEGVSTRGH